jgi:hypothetical protein
MFFAGSILANLYTMIGGALAKKPKAIDTIFGLLVVGGMVLFWVYDP